MASPPPPEVEEKDDHFVYRGFKVPKDSLDEKNLEAYTRAAQGENFAQQKENDRKNSQENYLDEMGPFEKKIYDQVWAPELAQAEANRPLILQEQVDLVNKNFPSKPGDKFSYSRTIPVATPMYQLQPDGTRTPVQTTPASGAGNATGGGKPSFLTKARQAAMKGYFRAAPGTEGIDDASKKEMEANTRLANVQADTSDQVAQQMSLANQEQETMLQKQMEQRALVDSQIQKRRDEINQATDKLAAEKVDAGHFWNSKSNGDKFMAGLAIVLGGIGSSVNGSSSNQALDIIKSAIDRDVETQKFNIDKGQRDLGNKRLNLQDLSNDAAMKEQRGIVDRETKYKIAIAKIEQLKQGAQSNEIKSKMDLVNQGLLKELSKIQYNNDLTARQVYGQQLATFLQMDALGLQREQLSIAKAAAHGKDEDIFKKIKTVQETMGPNNKTLEAFNLVSSARDTIKAAKKTGAVNLAQAKLIAKYLEQGSFPEEFADRLKTSGVMQKPGILFDKTSKGYDPKLFRDFENLIDEQYNVARDRAEPQLQLYRQAGSAYGIGEDYFVPKDTINYNALGAKRIP